MIASAHVRPCRDSQRLAHHSGNDDPFAFPPQGQTEIWTQLFQSALHVRKVRLQFDHPHADEVLTMVALDLRSDGWVVTGIPTGSTSPIEHCLDRITHVEVLGESHSHACETPPLPPMA